VVVDHSPRSGKNLVDGNSTESRKVGRPVFVYNWSRSFFNPSTPPLYTHTHTHTQIVRRVFVRAREEEKRPRPTAIVASAYLARIPKNRNLRSGRHCRGVTNTCHDDVFVITRVIIDAGRVRVRPATVCGVCACAAVSSLSSSVRSDTRVAESRKPPPPYPTVRSDVSRPSYPPPRHLSPPALLTESFSRPNVVVVLVRFVRRP